jgi:hypothetical protein
MEPLGLRTVVRIKNGEFRFFFEKDDTRVMKIGSTFNGIAIVEGYLIGKPPTIFVMCDILALNGVNVTTRRFDVRMGMIEENLFETWNASDSDEFVLDIRPFYPMNRYKKLMQIFTTKKIIFTRFPPRGLVIAPMDSGPSFLWEEVDSHCPKVILRVNYEELKVFGYAMTKSTSLAIALMGAVTPNTVALNGKVVEIEVISQDHTNEDWIHAVLKGPAFEERPWSLSDFFKWYPDRCPPISPEKMEEELARIAVMPQYE